MSNSTQDLSTHDPETVTLNVGNPPTAIVVRKDLLCSKSPFFAAAFTGSFREATNSAMDLPEDNYQVVAAFASWVAGDTAAGVLARTPLALLLPLYQFIDKIDCTELSDALVDAERERCDRPIDDFPTPKLVVDLHEARLDHTPACRFYRDLVCYELLTRHTDTAALAPWFPHPPLMQQFADYAVGYSAALAGGWMDPRSKGQRSHHHHQRGGPRHQLERRVLRRTVAVALPSALFGFSELGRGRRSSSSSSSSSTDSRGNFDGEDDLERESRKRMEYDG